MNSRVLSVAFVGVELRPARTEVFALRGGPSVRRIGSWDAVTPKARGWTQAVIDRSEFTVPGRRVVVNLGESSLILEPLPTDAISYRGRP